ncbi:MULTISPECIES: hypothetical protein [Novosphingobium]|uniref:hypothetical protein n=1 Tax=Novosphingobium TaxID=165696 RepID=UPI0012DD58A2|nr:MULTISPECIES: hypothetical protein [Novosphingobium]
MVDLRSRGSLTQMSVTRRPRAETSFILNDGPTLVPVLLGRAYRFPGNQASPLSLRSFSLSEASSPIARINEALRAPGKVCRLFDLATALMAIADAKPDCGALKSRARGTGDKLNCWSKNGRYYSQRECAVSGCIPCFCRLESAEIPERKIINH